MGIGFYNIECFFGLFSVNDGLVIFVVEDLMFLGCRDMIMIDLVVICSLVVCDIRVVVEFINCSDNGMLDDFSDDFFMVDVRVED